MVLLLSGCKSTYFHQRFPELEKPKRPTLTNIESSEMKKMSEKARTSVANNFNALIDYGKKLETAIDMYNAYAREKNKEIGLSKEKEK